MPNAARKKTCSVCKKPWWPWHGSALKTHAGCHFDHATQDEIARRWKTPERTEALAKEYGVTTGIIKASVHASLIRRGLPGLRRGG